MPRTSRAEGAGSSLTNLAGKGFEEDVFLKLLVDIEQRYTTQSLKTELKLSKTQEFFKIYEGTLLIGAIGTQSALFKYLGKPNYMSEWTNLNSIPERMKDVWEKDLIPDLFILNFRDEARFVTLLEVKYQNDSGSVDEKLQTGKFKKEMWNKLFRNLLDPDEEVNYAYILSNWFAQDSKKESTERGLYYQDTFDYLDDLEIPYWVNSVVDYQDKIVNGKIKYKKNSRKPQQVYLTGDLDFPNLDILGYLE